MTRSLISRSTVICGLWIAASAAIVAQSSSAYDPATEVTVTGTITHVVSFAAPDGSVGVHLDFKTPAGMLNVHVAPALFVGMENFFFFADDELQIVGTKSVADGNNAFLARTLKKDGKTLTLRNAAGKPAWTPAVEGTDGCGVAHTPLPRGTEL